MNPFQGLGLPSSSSVPSKYIVSLPSFNLSASSEKRYVLAAHVSWIREVVTSRTIPSVFPTHGNLQEDEVQAFLTQGKATALGPNWMFLFLTVLKASKCVETFVPLDETRSITNVYRQQQVNPSFCRTNASWPQIVDFIGESNFNFLWEQPQISLLNCPNDEGAPPSRRRGDGQVVQMEQCKYVNEVLQKLYPELDDGRGIDENLQTSGSGDQFIVSNLAQAICIINTAHLSSTSSRQKIENDHDHFLIFHPYSGFSLHDAVTFSPQKIGSTAKQLFIVYQILQYLRDLQRVGISPGDLCLRDVKLDECLHISVLPSMSGIIGQSRVQQTTGHFSAKGNAEVVDRIQCIVAKVRGWDPPPSLSSSYYDCKIDPNFIQLVVRHWCEGIVSNYDYLMFLNFLCGRFCNGNPNFYPVFPWISDLSSPTGVWRDFTKSKFRLNKGDRQLDIMYEDVYIVGMSEKSVAHHVTDILSEITYYVYKARRTPKDILCRFVRPKWVPAEYPASVVRMQEWTPDECIPEFFDDPTIFKSIHEDLPDLQVPKWAAGPEEFVHQHRKMLESDFVSAKLHHWIDLTFGYKLSGTPAAKAKNVYLSLADGHQNLESHGVVQLFHTPHPPRKNSLRDLRNIVQYNDLKRLREHEAEDLVQDANNTVESNAKTKKETWKNINLPKHYDPLGFFNDLEVTINFFKAHFPYLRDLGISLVGLKDRQELPHSIKLFGCLLLEIVLPQKFRHASNTLSICDKFNFYKDIIKSCMTLVPLFCRRAIQAIFDRDSLEFSIPLDVSFDLLLLGDKLGPIPFPSYFLGVYRMLKTIKKYDTALLVTSPEDAVKKLRLHELKVQSFSRDLIPVLGVLDAEGIDLVLPFVVELFEHPDTRVLAVWNLFSLFAKTIGRKKCVEHLLYPIVQIYESDYHSDKHLKLFHKTFLLQLCSCFGLKIFLQHFSTLLVEAIGGWKLPGEHNDFAPRAHLNVTELEDPDEENKDSSKTEPSTSSFFLKRRQMSLKRSESEAGDGLVSEPVEPELFVMEPDLSDSEGNDEPSAKSSSTVEATVPSVFVSDLRSSLTSRRSRNESPHPSAHHQSRENSTTRSGSSSSIGGVSGAGKSVTDISEICYESVLYLSHRLGPVLTAKYFSKNLLRMLTLCYMDHLEVPKLSSSKDGLNCDGDIHSSKVLDCLIAISDLFGDSFIERQYIPYGVDIVRSAKHKISCTSESALIGVATVLDRIFHHIPDALLMAQLQDPIINNILSPLVDIICSPSSEFPSGGVPRALLASKCLSMMNSIRKKIGPDLSQVHLRPFVLLICRTFQCVYTEKDNFDAKMATAFDPQLAARVFSYFCELITGTEYESLIRDLFVQHGLLDTPETTRENGSPSSDKISHKRKVEQQSSFGSRSFGNRIQVAPELEASPEEPNVITSSYGKKDSTRHLKGNWLLYWDHEIGRSDSKFNFKQIKLQTFTGHSGSIRWIHVLDNENSFLTASKDKTVKLFSLRNQGDENVVTSCQWTYPHHKKAVLSVLFHEPLHLAASTDGVIHVWDPFVGKAVRILEKGISTKNGPVCALKPILHTSNFVGAGIDSTIHVIDCRTCNAYEMKIGIGQASGLVRCVAVSDNGQIVSVGHSSGMLSTLDLRNGTLLGSWKGHDGEVLQLVPYRNKQLISSSFDQNISVWNLDDNRLAFNIRGPTEPVHSLCTYESELISCSTSNRIGIHCGIDAHSDFSSTRLRTDAFKGVVTSMRLLPKAS